MFSSARRLPPVRHPRLALATVVVVACLAAPLASAAAAATRYASPTGTGVSPCLETAPCSIETAISFAGGLKTGDTVLLAPGTYHPAGELIVGGIEITISAEPGKAAPLIEAAGQRAILAQNQVTLRDLRFHTGPGIPYGVVVTRVGSIVERVESTGEASQACGFVNVTVRDSLCVTEAPGGTALTSTFAGSLTETEEVNLSNVTAIGSTGIDAVANDHSTVKIKAVNVIARGSEFDVAAEVQSVTSAVEIELAHSNFATRNPVGGAVITPPTANANQGAAPVFVDAAGGNYREAENSPTRLAGDLGVVLPGELDLDSQSRTTDCAGTVGVDIGAYQYECPAPEQHEQPSSGTPSSGTPSSGTNPGNTDTGTQKQLPPTPAPTAPQLSKLSIRPPKFVVAGAGKVPKGTARSAAVTFTLSEAASVRFEVAAKKAVKGKKPKPITFTVPDATGPNTVKLGGKVKGKALEPGKYTLRVTATDGVLSSTPQTKTFEVLPAAS